MSRFATYVSTAIGFTVLLMVVGFWTAPSLVAQVRAALIRDSDNPALQPFQASGSCVAGGGSCNGAIFIVPAGKRAVVEYFSAAANMPSGKGIFGSIITTVNSTQVEHFLTITEDSSATRFSTVGGTVRLYAEPGTTIFGGAGATPGIPGTVLVQISGYLVNIP